MFFSVNSERFSSAQPGLAAFARDRTSVIWPASCRIFTYYTLQRVTRSVGLAGVLNTQTSEMTFLSELTYPHHLIDLAFLVGDSQDDTLAVLAAELARIQKQSDTLSAPFRSALIVEKNFGISTSQTVEERHAFAAQGPRRVIMAKARNYLLSTALKPEHSWVYWRDADMVDCPKKIIEDFTAHDRDVIVPSRLP